MAEQLVFDLPLRAARGREDFFVSPANAMAVAQVENWRRWPARKLVLVGPQGAGKTHLAHVWAAQADAGIVEAAALPRT
ncbi:MAG: chromosomal replication initiator DnaA, partial [Paracoccaceae bacterium]